MFPQVASLLLDPRSRFLVASHRNLLLLEPQTSDHGADSDGRMKRLCVSALPRERMEDLLGMSLEDLGKGDKVSLLGMSSRRCDVDGNGDGGGAGGAGGDGDSDGDGDGPRGVFVVDGAALLGDGESIHREDWKTGAPIDGAGMPKLLDLRLNNPFLTATDSSLALYAKGLTTWQVIMWSGGQPPTQPT